MKGLPLGKRLIYCSHLQIIYVSSSSAWQQEDFPNYTLILDDIKVFEPSEEGVLTAQVTVRCSRSMRKKKLHIDFCLIWTVQDRKPPKITPRSAYLKIRGRLTPQKPKQAPNRQRKKLNANTFGKKGQERSWTQKAYGKVIKKDETTQITISKQMS